MSVMPRTARAALLVGAAVAGCATAAPPEAADVVGGRGVYERECLACHMTDGRGVPGMSPALIGSPWLSGTPQALAGFVLTGGFGPDVLMARFDYLSDAELAALLTYVRGEFGGVAEPTVTAAEVAAVRGQLR